ncbi:hypothetical protein K440DRAFT_171742 [Wilcoxina mikolae CBS 423.85]|nr:hypothetical protein K440DRAFT_171742 [Wilcoxina mikolae CBS 423.85]
MAENPRTNPLPYHPPLVTYEWAATSPPIPATSPQHRTFTPRTFSPPSSHHHHPRTLSPPSSSSSSSPSPCPSLSPTSMVEIEELEDDGIDSGIELLHGEFEDAPDEPQQQEEDSDSDSEDEDSEKRTVLRGLQRLWAQQHPSRKRGYAESLDGSSEGGGDESGGENTNTDSSSGGRIRRRKLAPVRKSAEEEESSRKSTPEFMMEMEL